MWYASLGTMAKPINFGSHDPSSAFFGAVFEHTGLQPRINVGVLGIPRVF